MQNEENAQGFVRTKLPWIAAAGVFILFLVTLNQWVNLRSMPLVSRVAGWDWALPAQQPLFFLVTYPFSWLPESIQPLALNAFAALCAALSLALLARSVALLPHDRTHEQRLRERSEHSLLSIKLAWLPPLFAVLVCALQLTFWEHATVITGEMLDLLVFAYVIRCLLEFRISLNDRWLVKLSFVYGLGVTNNWALIAFFPAFLAAMIWIKGIRFFEGQFVLRMLLAGLAGLLLYFLLPIVWMVQGGSDMSFWEILKANLVSQKMYIVNSPQLRVRTLLISLTTLVPAALIGIRWPSSFGDTSAAGASLTNLAFRIIHLFFLGAWLWVVFDPKYSPRELGLGLSFLTFYYLGALVVGYYSGYALLVFTEAPRKGPWVRQSPLAKFINPIVRAAVVLAFIGVPVGLLLKNYPLVQLANGKILKEFTARMAGAMPRDTGYVLSEDIFLTGLLQAHFVGEKGEQPPILVNTRSLPLPDYHFQMRRQYGERWPDIGRREEIGARLEDDLIQFLVTDLARSNRLVYLQPSFGYFFERLYPEPTGPIYQLHLYEKDQVFPSKLTAEQLERNQKFWAELSPVFENLAAAEKAGSRDAKFITTVYSRAINTWGVYLQRHDRTAEAREAVKSALRLNPDSLSAAINSSFLESLPDVSTDLEDLKEFQQRFKSWGLTLEQGGYIEHPGLCLPLGELFLSQLLVRQSAQQFSRTIHYQSTNYNARLGLAKSLIYGNWFERGLAEMQKILEAVPNLSTAQRLELIALEAVANFNKGDFNKAEQLLVKAQNDFPQERSLSRSLAELYKASGRLTNALSIIDQELQRSPTNVVLRLQKAETLINLDRIEQAQGAIDQVLVDNPNNTEALLLQVFASIQATNYPAALRTADKILERDSDNLAARIYKGIVHMEQKEYENARDQFDRVLEEQPANDVALRNRAILNLRTERFSAAKKDYELLQKMMPRSHAVYYGLGEIAYKQRNYAEALRNYETYMKYVPKEGGRVLQEEKQMIQTRIEEMRQAQK